MKKVVRIVNIGLLGIFIGIAVGFLAALAFSFIYQSKYFVPSAPHFVAHFSSNTAATGAAAILWALMGLVFSASAIIFDKENWSITRQTVTHFLISYLCFTPLALLAGWFPLEPGLMITYTLIFIGIYIVMWFIFMLIARKRIDELNKAIKKYH